MALQRSSGRLSKILPVFVAGLIVLGFATLLKASQEMGRYDRILLIRGLDHEVAVAKIPLPWGKHGVHIKRDGQVDQAQVMKELHAKGESVKPGIPVEITDIKFKPGRIMFAINGGGNTGEHWYQHLQIGMGGLPDPMMSRDTSTTPSNGSYVTVYLPSSDPSPSVDRVKKMLAGVLDFARRGPTVLYSPAIPAQFKDAIKKHQVALGMDRACVLSAKGAPDHKVRKDLQDGSEEEDWLYGDPPHVLFVIFIDDSVAKIQQY
ncbi:MAG: hypothetical protein ACRD1I_03840 [Terriglobia bacterium]